VQFATGTLHSATDAARSDDAGSLPKAERMPSATAPTRLLTAAGSEKDASLRSRIGAVKMIPAASTRTVWRD